MRVSFSKDAEQDFRDIADHIAVDDPKRARSFVRELRTRALGIADAPRGYQLVERYESTGVRRRVVGSYLIFYRIETGRIDIVRVLHGSRDYDRILRDGRG